MALIKDALELKEYIFKHPEELENCWFILTYAPYCAKHMDPRTDTGKIFMDILNQMFQKHEYTIPFYYIGYLRFNSQNTSAADCKGFLRSMCNDLDRVTKWFSINGYCTNEDPNYTLSISPTMIEYIKTFISGVRKKQLEVGANESAMLNYAPIIPYNYMMSRDKEFNKNIVSENFLENIITEYGNVYESAKLYETLSTIAMQNANWIIEKIDYPFYHWTCPMDIFTIFGSNRISTNDDTLKYLLYIWLLNNSYSASSMMQQYHDYNIFIKHKYIPLKRDEFNSVFESMCKYETGNIQDMMTTEAWSALAEDSQSLANHFLETVPKSDKMDETYNLDALLSEFYTMRHVETNDYTNQFFLAEIPGININSYNFINDNIMICEINSKYLVIPYIDIACDYKIKMIGIDKDNQIMYWDDLDDFNQLGNE